MLSEKDLLGKVAEATNPKHLFDVLNNPNLPVSVLLAVVKHNHASAKLIRKVSNIRTLMLDKGTPNLELRDLGLTIAKHQKTSELVLRQLANSKHDVGVAIAANLALSKRRDK